MDLIESYQPQEGIAELNATVSYLAEGACSRQNVARVTHIKRCLVLMAGHSELGVLSYKLFSGKEGSWRSAACQPQRMLRDWNTWIPRGTWFQFHLEFILHVWSIYPRGWLKSLENVGIDFTHGEFGLHKILLNDIQCAFVFIFARQQMSAELFLGKIEVFLNDVIS